MMSAWISILLLEIVVLVQPSIADNPGYVATLEEYEYQVPYQYYNQESDVAEEKVKEPFARADGYNIAMLTLVGTILFQMLNPNVLPALLGPITGPLGILLMAITAPFVAIVAPILTLIANVKGRSLDLGPSVVNTERLVEELSMMVNTVVESDECLPRIVCRAGRYADGRSKILKIVETVTPKHFSRQLKVFKESALGSLNCSNYKCSYLDWNNI